MEVGNVYQTKNDIQKQADQRHAHMDKILQKQMAFDEKLQKLLEEAKRVKPFNYDSVFTKNIEFKKQNTSIWVKFKALSMEEKYANFWWHVVHDIVQKNIGKVYKM